MGNAMTKNPTATQFELRPYQQKAVTAILKDLESMNKVGLIMPTGAGKTEVFIKIADEFLNANPHKTVLILSHLSLLTEQTSQRFKLRAPHIKVGVFQADEMPPQNSRVIIGTMQTSSSERKSNRLKMRLFKSVGLIIIDEAHYLTCDSYESALDAFPHAAQIGCTATPFRSGALMTNYFDKVSFSISIKELIAKKYLVNPNLIEVTDNSESIEQKMALIASIYKEKEAGKNALIFMKTIEDAKQMRNVLDDHGINARAVTSELWSEDREDIFKDFRSGKIKILTTVNVLTAGFDSANIEAIFMPYATKSPTVYLQRIGRGLRIDPRIDKKECRIYVCGDSPSIKRELYKKLHDNVLEINSRKKKTTTFEEDLEYTHESADEIYQWNKTVVDTIQIMKGLNLDRIAKVLNTKKFPKRFLNDIGTFKQGLITANPTGSDDPAPKSKLSMLKSLGFTKDCMKDITSYEASALITAGLAIQKEWAKRPFTLSSGKFPGTHISDLPMPYVAMIKSRYPFSAIAKTLREYEAQGGIYRFNHR